MNLSEILAIAAEIVPDREATVFGDRRTSYRELADRAGALAGSLSSRLGVAPGDRVAWMDVNSDRGVEALFGIAGADAVSVPASFRARARELSFMLKDSGARVLFAGARYAGEVAEVMGSASERPPGLMHLVCTSGETPAGWIPYESLVGSGGAGPAERDGDDLAMILYTAGTTGRPKGVMLSHGGLSSHLFASVNPADPDYEQRTLLSVPLYHVAGVQVALSSIYGGRVLVVQSQFEAGEWLRLVEGESITRATLVPTMLKAAIEHPDFDSRDVSSLRILTYGAAPMPAGVILSAIERMPGVRFINAFGQTESGATITVLPPEDHDLTGPPEIVEMRRRRLSSIGRPLEGVEIMVVDEDGAEVPTGAEGEIVARSERLMTGYWGREDATGRVLRDGWLHTGDLGWVDEDGYVYLSGRARDFIKRGGEMIAPEEVESVLREHPCVEDAAVIGVPDPHWGESVRAIVVPAARRAVIEEEIIEHCRVRLAAFKRPASVIAISELPRNALGKVLKRELRRRFSDP